MTDNLIAEIKRLCDETDIETNEPTQAWLVGNLRAAIARHEAHTPTNDEREALVSILEAPLTEDSRGRTFSEMLADVILIRFGFRRSVVPEPSTEQPKYLCPAHPFGCSEPQGEPSDAQVLAALNAYAPWAAEYHLSDWGEGSAEPMRAALRAAFAVTEQGENR